MGEGKPNGVRRGEGHLFIPNPYLLRFLMSNPFIHHISEQISAASGLPAGEIAEKIEIPPDPKLGDYAFPCFPWQNA